MEHEDNPGLLISRLLQVAMSEPRGPVYVSIPQETAMLSLPGTARFPTRDQLGLARPAWPDPADAHTIARWLVQADNPVLYTTRAGRDPDAVTELVRLAEINYHPQSGWFEDTPLKGGTEQGYPLKGV